MVFKKCELILSLYTVFYTLYLSKDKEQKNKRKRRNRNERACNTTSKLWNEICSPEEA